jgi:N-acyl-D-aspartate/D-glutamate deacylase
MDLNQAFYAEGSDLLEFMSSVDAEGGKMIGLSHPYGLTIIYSFKTNLPFDRLDEWKAIRELPLSEQVRLLRDPEVRERLVKEANQSWKSSEFSNLIYEENPLPPNRSLAEIARERGVDPVEAMIDLSLETNFNAMFKHILHKYDDEYLLAAMRHPRSAMTFSDSGAHVGSICDFNIQTYFLAYWVRERKEFSLEEAIKLITSAPAEIWSLPGRGLVKEGYIADLNVFDPDEVAPITATAERDFPGGVVHLQQKAVGIEATVVAGEVTMRQGEPTGVLPGRLIRRGAAAN